MQLYNFKELQECYSGETEIQKIVYGEETVWEYLKVYDVGSGRSVNVSNIKGHENFTVNNFFVRAIGSPSASDTVTGIRPNGPNARLHSQLNKTYNQSTGIFNVNFQCYATVSDKEITSNNSVPCKVYVVPEITEAIAKGKVKNLGSGYTWNIKNLYPDLYNKFTIENFGVLTCDNCQVGARYYEGTFSFGGYATLNLSYNPSTGILTGSNYITVTNSGGGYIQSGGVPITPYLFIKV